MNRSKLQARLGRNRTQEYRAVPDFDRSGVLSALPTGSFFRAPRMFVAARANWRTISAYALSCSPQMIQRALLSRNTQKAMLRFFAERDPIIQAAITVTAIAGH